jgi:hypothetical protein
MFAMSSGPSFTSQPVPRRARQPDSLAVVVIGILTELQCPLATPAMRIILTDRGRSTKAEQLSRLAAYQREDFARSHIAPPLCWTVELDGTATTPRWWALSEWRFGRRIRTEDVGRLWLAHLAERLTSDLSENPHGRTDELISLALGTVARLIGPQTFDVPTTGDDWAAIHTAVYKPFVGAFSNMTGVTSEQHEVEQRLSDSLSGFDRLFGKPGTR